MTTIKYRGRIIEIKMILNEGMADLHDFIPLPRGKGIMQRGSALITAEGKIIEDPKEISEQFYVNLPLNAKEGEFEEVKGEEDFNGFWSLVVDPYTIEIKPIHQHIEYRLGTIFEFEPPLEIVKESEWQENRCAFLKNGLIRQAYYIDGANIRWNKDDANILDKFEYVAFFKRPHAANGLAFYEFPEYTEITQSFLHIPIPIQCTVRDMNAEEKLMLSHYEAMPLDEQAREQERTEKERIEKREQMMQNFVNKRARLAKRNGKRGGAPIKDGEKIMPAIAKVFELLRTKKSKTMERACNIVIKVLQLHIKWQALAKQVRKAPQWKNLKKRIAIERKTTNVIN